MPTPTLTAVLHRLAPDGELLARYAREQFAGTLKDDVLILVVPEKVHNQFEPFRSLPEVESLPQAFPGQPAKPGDPVPPPKKK